MIFIDEVAAGETATLYAKITSTIKSKTGLTLKEAKLITFLVLCTKSLKNNYAMDKPTIGWAKKIKMKISKSTLGESCI